MFNDKLGIKVPTLWTKMSSDTNVDWRYADRSHCSKRTKAANCPSIRFSSLTTTRSSDLLKEWTETPCENDYDPIGQRSGPISYTLNEEPVDFYVLRCSHDTQPVRYAWHFDARDVLVTTHAGKVGDITPEIVEAVLSRANWR
jgi:hypothetical protein